MALLPQLFAGRFRDVADINRHSIARDAAALVAAACRHIDLDKAFRLQDGPVWSD